MFGISKLVPYGIAVIILGVLFASYGHLRYKAGQADIQAQFDSYRVTQAEAFAAQVQKVQELQKANDELNKRITDELQPKLAAADARGRDLARRLSQALAARPDSSPVPPADSPGSADGSGGIPGDGGEIGIALAAHLSACSRDAMRLNGWRGWYRELDQ